MCIRCQSDAQPSRAEYWHMGDITTRLGSVKPRSFIGVNKLLGMNFLLAI